MRARIILLGASGLNDRKVADYVDCTPTSIGNWKKRWKEKTPKNKRKLKVWLEDLPRPGAPCRFSLDQRAQLIALACENTFDHDVPTTTWTSEELRGVAVKEGIVPDISRRHVSRILKEVDLKPHRFRYWLNSKADPEKNEKSQRLTKSINRLKT